MTADAANSRRLVYTLLITVAAAIVAGHIVGAERVLEPSLHKARPEEKKGRTWPEKRPPPMPTFSSNDISRWATVRALVDKGTFVIGERDRKNVIVSAVTPVGAWHGVDTAVLAQAGFLVRSKKKEGPRPFGSDSGIIFEPGWESVDKVLHPGKLEFYSSKPPLLSVLIAGLYWVLQTLTQWTLASQPFAVVRTILLLVNGVLFVVYLVLLSRVLERYGKTDWGRYFVLAAACFATLVTPFLITLNNHTIATFTVMFALYPALRILEGRGGAGDFALAGLLAAFTACMELPAASFALALSALLLWQAPRRTLALFVPAALVPLVAFFAVNYVAVGQWRPAYSEFGGPWYQYEGSHWRATAPGELRAGIDYAWTQEPRAMYWFHFFLGHHGWFALTSLWVLAVWGMGRVSLVDVRRWLSAPHAEDVPPFERRVLNLIIALTILVSVAVIGFYLLRSDNYGGWTNGLRWLMWLSPLWLLTLLPVADYLAERRWGRTLGVVLLSLSILSVNFSVWNPWRHPWIYRLMEGAGWPGY